MAKNKERKPNGYWNSYDNCKAEAANYRTRGEFKKGSYQAWFSSLKNKWIDDFGLAYKTKPNGYWTFEECKNVAENFTRLKDFKNKYPSAYTISVRNKWIEKFDWLKQGKSSIKTDTVYAYLFINNTVYVGRTVDIINRHSSHKTRENDAVFKYAKANNFEVPNMTILESEITIENGLIMEDYYVNRFRLEGWNVLNKAKTGIKSGSVGILNNRKWNQSSCYSLALECKTQKEFQKKSLAAFKNAKENGWLKEYTWFKPYIKWTYKTCFIEAKKYKSRGEFCKKNQTAYGKSLANKWIDDYTWFVPLWHKWSKEQCDVEANKYKTLTDFIKNSKGAYLAARRNGWIIEYDWLERVNKKGSH